MKNLILATAVTIGALALIGCQSTSNSPTPAAATSVCTNGTQVVNGVTMQCNTGGYGYTVGAGGVPTPYTGTQGAAGGCSYWSYVYASYGAYYVPMIDAGTGQLECVNVGSSGQQTLANYGYTGQSPLYYQNQYYAGSGYGGGYYPGYYNDGSYSNYNSGTCIGVGIGDLFGGVCGNF